MARDPGSRFPRYMAADIARMNPVLLEGQAVYELDSRQIKIGDGFTPYNDLLYVFTPSLDFSNYPTNQQLNDAIGQAVVNLATKSQLTAGLADKASKTELSSGLSGKANQSDLTAGLAGKAPLSHTHQPSDVTDIVEFIQDTVAGLLKAGTNVTVVYDDVGNGLTINSVASSGSGPTDPEIVRDVIGAAIVASTGIQVVVNDAADTISISVANIPQAAVVGLTDALAAVYTKTQADAKFGLAREVVGHEFGAQPDDNQVATSLTGQAITYTGPFGITTLSGKRCMYAPLDNGNTAMSIATSKKPMWGRLRFSFLINAVKGSELILAISSKATIDGTQTMNVRLVTTENTWKLTLWNSGAESVLASGNYARDLPLWPGFPIDLEMAFRVDGNTVTYVTPDGIIRKYTDPLIGSLGGNFITAIARTPAGAPTAAYPVIFGLWEGDAPPHTILDTRIGLGDVKFLFDQKVSYASLDAYQPKAEKGAANGYAALDSTGKVPPAQLPASSGGGGGNDPRFDTYAQNFGGGSGSPYTIPHGKNSKDILSVTTFRRSTGKPVILDWQYDSSDPRNKIQILSETPFAANEMRLTMAFALGFEDVVLPAKATITQIAKDSSTITVQGAATDNVGVAYINYYRGGTLIGNAAPGVNFVHTGLNSSTQYVVTATGVDTSGNEGPASDALTITTNAPPPDTTAPSKPAIALNSKSQTTVSLTATATDNVGVTTWQWYRGGVAISGATSATLNDSSLTAGTAYSYTARAGDAAGNTTMSDAFSVTTNANAIAFSKAVVASSNSSPTVTSPSIALTGALNTISVVVATISHTAWAAESTFTTVAVTSSNGDVYTKLGVGQNAPGGQETGQTWIFYKLNPTGGAQTITGNIGKSGMATAQLTISVLEYTNVAAINNFNSNSYQGGNAAGNVQVTGTSTNNLVLGVLAFDFVRPAFAAGPTERTNVGGAGDAWPDSVTVGDAPAPASGQYTFSSSGNTSGGHTNVGCQLVRA